VGLALLAPSARAARTAQERAARPAEPRPDDIVLGEFLGDQELLILAPSEAGPRRILIALPLDRRADWFSAAQDLGEFPAVLRPRQRQILGAQTGAEPRSLLMAR
jgi:hypothetical protein